MAAGNGAAAEVPRVAERPIRVAEVVVHDRLASRAVLDLAPQYQAARYDHSSPLRGINFWTVITLLALIIVLTVISFTVADRPLMAVAALIALGLVSYTLYIPTIGSDGFGAYGSSYWASLVAAAVMVLGTGLAAVMT